MTITGVVTTRRPAASRRSTSACSATRAKRRATLAGLEAAHGLLQARLARQLRMKRTPQLTFEYDLSVERGVRMTQLIDELAPDGDDADD